MAERLEILNIDDISPNDENPRLRFHAKLDERLADSISTSGVLVPVYVYKEGDKYRLIDGERRWTQAKRLGFEEIPALVRDEKPDPALNIVEMFNIHLVRAEWDDMPTAKALKKVMERKETTDPDELKRLTGLSKEKIKDFQLILDLPERYQEAIDDGLPMNFFVELEENVIRPLAKRRPRIAADYSDDEIRDAFLAKREKGVLSDVVQLRKFRPIVIEAAKDAGEPDDDSQFDEVIRDLIDDVDADVEEAFNLIALARTELNGLGKSMKSMFSSVDRLIKVTDDQPGEREELVKLLETMRDGLTDRIDVLD